VFWVNWRFRLALHLFRNERWRKKVCVVWSTFTERRKYAIIANLGLRFVCWFFEKTNFFIGVRTIIDKKTGTEEGQFQEIVFFGNMSMPTTILTARSTAPLSGCYGATIIPQRPSMQRRVRRSSRFSSFDGVVSISAQGTNPIPLPAQVQTQSPARFARLLLAAYRNRHIKFAPISTLGAGQRIYRPAGAFKCIVVEERSGRVSDGGRPQRRGQSQCTIRTRYQSHCTAEQIERALHDLLRVEQRIDSGQVDLSGVVSGCDSCAEDAVLPTEPCQSCPIQQNGVRRCRKQPIIVPASPSTTLANDEIAMIMHWYTTGVSIDPPTEFSTD